MGGIIVGKSLEIDVVKNVGSLLNTKEYLQVS